MILYFADRNLNILGQASTHLPEGVKVVDDLTTEDLETGVSIFECDIPFNRSTRAKVQEWAELGNYILKSSDGENKLYSIIDAEIDTKKQRASIYAEDDGLDLLNEVVGEYEADQYYPIAYYVEKYAAGSGWEIGINEVEGLTRKLNLDSEETTHARLLRIAAAFNNCNLSFSFDIDGLQVKKKYINIYAERGKDTGEQLRLNKEIDGIITTKSIANLATALQVTGGTPDNAETPITLKGYSYDDGDFYIEGSVLKSRKALEKWQRFLWKNDESQQAGGHIVKQYSSDTLSQEELCLNAIEELKLICDMEINFEVDATEFPENARIGDRVNIIDDEGELYLSSRILILETSEANNTRTAVLGEHLIRKSGISSKVEKLAAQFAKTSVTAARANMLANNANEIAEEAKTQAETALNEANAVVGVAENAKTTAEAAQEAALNAKAEAEAAEAAANAVVEKVEGFETAINNAQAAADNAYTAAETATAKAEEAETAANNALTELETSKEAMQAAQNTAENAISKAETAEDTAATAKSEAEAASSTARAAKLDAEAAQKEIDNLSLELTTVEQTMTAEYARKTDLTEATADLQTQISQNAAEISSTASKVTFIDETANNAAAQAQAAFYTAEQAQQEADEATALAVQAQNEADTAQEAADNAQAEADTARQAAETAKSVADQAEADLIQAQKDLDNIRASATATEAEIAAAETAVQNAQATATNAQAEAAEALSVANNAQAAADTAVTNAVNAQNYADYAAKQAEIAQLAADKVSESAASQAMQKANDAQSTANTAQNTANTAKANADNAQSIANTAAATAANAQAIADEAKSDMQKAEADLQEAKQTLADVTSRVDSTEEEVQAAQAAVETAKSKADEAKANAEAAQATADTAKANAATAQTAANNAKTAADNAQAAADEAQAAADKALEDVGKLETRVTTAETKITQNAEQIALRATKKEVTETLGGYYTKEESDAAITVKADEITSSVEERFEGLQVGGRNLVHDSETEVSFTNIVRTFYLTEYAQANIKGRKVTISFDAYSDEAGVGVDFYLRYMSGSEGVAIGNTCINLTGSYERYYATITATAPVEDIMWFAIRTGKNSIASNKSTTATIFVKNVKVEFGTMPTDWTPAPEDMATSDDLDTLASRVTAAETNITQNSEQIKLAATKEEVTTTLNGYYTKSETDAAISVKADEIALNVSNTYATKQETNASIQVLNNQITSNVTETNSLKTRMSTVEQTAEDLTLSVAELGATNSASGEAITLNDSSDGGLIDLKIYGKTTQAGTPTPDAPIDLVSVGDNGSSGVAVYNKNLCNPHFLEIMASSGASNTYDATTYTITLNANDTAGATGRYAYPYRNFEIGKEYTISFDIKGTSGKIVNCGWNRRPITITLTDQFTRYSFTITAKATAEPIVFYSTKTANGGLASGEYMQFANIQIERGTQATEYEPFNKQYLYLTYQLRGVGGIKDEINFDRGVLIQRLEKVVLNGSEAWATNGNNQGYGLVMNNVGGDTTGSFASNMLCDKLTATGQGSIYNGAATNGIATRGDVSKIYVRIDNTLTTVALFKAWLASNPITVIYPLATPIETALTEEELEAYRALHTNSPITNIFADGSPELFVEYFSNTKDGQALAKNTASIQIASDRISSRVATAESDIDDNAQSISEAETNIEQLSNQISTLVQDGSGKSLMTQTSSGWVFSMGDFEEALNNLLAHIKIGTYNGSPCLELTVDDTKQKLMLTNTEIRFMESDTTAAYITGDIMNIDNANIENKLSVGGYEWSVDSDGTLNLVYQ